MNFDLIYLIARNYRKFSNLQFLVIIIEIPKGKIVYRKIILFWANFSESWPFRFIQKNLIKRLTFFEANWMLFFLLSILHHEIKQFFKSQRLISSNSNHNMINSIRVISEKFQFVRVIYNHDVDKLHSVKLLHWLLSTSSFS